MKYKTIVIDPPWPISTTMILKKYPKPLPYTTMSIEKIRSFYINTFAADECSLFMWVTHTFLSDALDIIKSWGFKYHCVLTWYKVSGYSNSGIFRNTELCLFAYRGKMNINQSGKFIPCLITEKKRNHSRKPDIFFDIIRNNTPEPRISIFERQLRNGFDVWGAEAPGNDIERIKDKNGDK